MRYKGNKIENIKNRFGEWNDHGRGLNTIKFIIQKYKGISDPN